MIAFFLDKTKVLCGLPELGGHMPDSNNLKMLREAIRVEKTQSERWFQRWRAAISMRIASWWSTLGGKQNVEQRDEGRRTPPAA